MKIIINTLIIACLIVTSSCATFKQQINKERTIPFSKEGKQLSHSFYLIGDAGHTKNSTGENEVLKKLQERLKREKSNSTALFLGDNVPSIGFPEQNGLQKRSITNTLNNQISTVTDFKGNTIFIPGNQDWADSGVKGLKKQQEYIEEKLGNESFYPKNGCPIEKVNISDDIVVLAIDSQWYLEDWDENPTINDGCEIKTREKFFEELEGLIKKNSDKTTLIAMHHPMFSNGPHGGQFSARQHIFPFNNNIPLPGIGSLINLVKKTGGISSQDIQNRNYQSLRNRVVTLAQESRKVIFVSGHEHSLQYIKQDNLPQIISGSGTETTATKATGKGVFSYGGYGYAKLDVYSDGSSQVSYYAIQDGVETVVFSTEVLPTELKKPRKDYPVIANMMESKSIYKEEETDKSNFHKFIWGERYRNDYSQKVAAPTVDLDTLFGGLTPVRKGGGHQSKSLRLVDKNGSEYVMRALRKSALKYLQAVAFKDKYIEGQFDNTVAESQLLDVFTGSHPYAPFTIATLSDAVGVYHTNPVLYYIPKQNALKGFNDEFGDELYMIEERAASNHGTLESFGFSNKLISTDDLLKKLHKNNKHYLDEDAYIKARLFDMLIGDWDRHEDQWRWATFKQEDGTTMYRPVPRDRDQAFSIMADGALLNFMTRVVPSLRLMQSYNEELRSPKWFNLEPYPLDVSLITKSDKSVWDEQVAHIQNNLTDEVIEEAFKFIPKEVNGEAITDIKRKLKGRRSNLNTISDIYFNHINKFVNIKGTDKDDYFTIEGLPNKQTHITVHNIKSGEKGKLIHNRIYDKTTSKEIWIYGLDDKDVFEVKGKQSIKLRIVGGQNKDTYIVENGKNVHLYDYKSKTNNFDEASKARIHKEDKYDINTYNHRKLKYTANQFIPAIAANPDDGLSLGFVNTLTHYGFARNPFSSQHKLAANYHFSTSGFNIAYTGEFANILGNMNLLVEGDIKDSNYADNFFGFGNETIYDDENQDLDFYRVRQSSYKVATGFVYRGKQGAEISIKGLYESFELEDTENRILTSGQNLSIPIEDQPELFERKDFVGVELNYSFENYNDKAAPTLGMHFEFESGYKVNTDDSDRSIFYLKPSIGFIRNLTQDHRWVLASKVASHINIGDQEDLELYQSARIGRIDGLRGFNNERFSGKNSFYSSSDIRYGFKKLKSGFAPINLGFYGGFDVGRVWLDGESSDKWHTSVGGGMWVTVAELLTTQLGVFSSSDGALIAFKLGFGI